MRVLSQERLVEFKKFLIEEEKSKKTIEKYVHDLNFFYKWIPKKEIEKHDVLMYKQFLLELYAVASVNSMISSLNSFFTFLKWFELRLKTVKVQNRLFYGEEKNLSKDEYELLIKKARDENNDRLGLIMQTLCCLGIRVSELRFITFEALKNREVEINSKGKIRYAFLPALLCDRLSNYCIAKEIKSGPIFITKNGKPLDRSNIWTEMRKLCIRAGISCEKVFPHNLRHLFARTYYTKERDIVRLADILGHSSINTTRIYTKESGEIHRKQVQNLGLL